MEDSAQPDAGESWLANNATTHEFARNSRSPARNYDERHRDNDAEPDDTRIDLRLGDDDGSLVLVHERYCGVKFIGADEREDMEDADSRLVVYGWHRDGSLELTDEESRQAMDQLSGYHTVDTATIRERAEDAMESLSGDQPLHVVESDLQHIHARAGGEMEELYDGSD